MEGLLLNEIRELIYRLRARLLRLDVLVLDDFGLLPLTLTGASYRQRHNALRQPERLCLCVVWVWREATP